MRLMCIIVIGLIVGFSPARSQAQTPEVPIHVSLCEIKAHPEKYLKKLVEFTAVASHGFEDSMVEDNQCPWPTSGPGVWMEYGGSRSTDTMYCCGFSPKPTRDKPLVVDDIPLSLVDDEKFQEFDARLHPKHSKPQRTSDTVKATLRGRIFGRHEGIGGTQQSPAWRGYGHMGCCMLFIVAGGLGRHTSSALVPTSRLIASNSWLNECIGDFASTRELVLLHQISESRFGHFASIRRFDKLIRVSWFC